MRTRSDNQQVFEVARGIESADQRETSERGAGREALSILIGTWINEGETVAGDSTPPLRIVTSDIYEWGAGRSYVIHRAYGRLGGFDVGGTEIITYDAEQDTYRSFFFDCQGNVTTSAMTLSGHTCSWHGESTRATAVFSEDGRVQTAHHERTDDGGETWQPSMEVVLTKVG